MKNIFYLSTLLILLVSTGCKTLYDPNMINSPMITKQGDLSLNITQKDFQVAYALNNNLGIMANGYIRNENVTSNSNGVITTNEKDDGYLIETGLGYTYPLTVNLYTDIFAGAGLGQINFNVNPENVSENRKFTCNGTKLFFQPGLFYKSDYISISTNLRLSIVSFNNPIFTNYTEQNKIDDKLNEFDKQPYLFIEPGVTLFAGYKWIKLFAQVGKSFKLTDKPINNNDAILNLGLNINFNI